VYEKTVPLDRGVRPRLRRTAGRLQQVRNCGDARYAVHERTGDALDECAGNAVHERAVTLRFFVVSQPHLRSNAEVFLPPRNFFFGAE
jgi:hypothetical protein